MTVQELIEKLRGMPSGAIVSLYDVGADQSFSDLDFKVISENAIQIRFDMD